MKVFVTIKAVLDVENGPVEDVVDRALADMTVRQWWWEKIVLDSKHVIRVGGKYDDSEKHDDSGNFGKRHGA